MTAIPVNQLKRKAIRIKSVRKIRNRTLQNHRQAILIRPMTVNIDARDIKGRALERGYDKVMGTFNGKVADDSV